MNRNPDLDSAALRAAFQERLLAALAGELCGVFHLTARGVLYEGFGNGVTAWRAEGVDARQTWYVGAGDPVPLAALNLVGELFGQPNPGELEALGRLVRPGTPLAELRTQAQEGELKRVLERLSEGRVAGLRARLGTAVRLRSQDGPGGVFRLTHRPDPAELLWDDPGEPDVEGGRGARTA